MKWWIESLFILFLLLRGSFQHIPQSIGLFSFVAVLGYEMPVEILFPFRTLEPIRVIPLFFLYEIAPDVGAFQDIFVTLFYR